MLPGDSAGSLEPPVEDVDELDESASRKRLFIIVLFVAATVGASLSVYLFWRPVNRHPEPTPYDNLIGQIRASMSEEDVLALFRQASDGNPRAEVRSYDEPSISGSRHVISYRIGSDEPLNIRMGGPTGRTAAEWCYRDHCYDNIE